MSDEVQFGSFFTPTDLSLTNLSKCAVKTGTYSVSTLPGPTNAVIPVDIGAGFQCVVVMLSNYQLTVNSSFSGPMGVLRNEIFNLSVKDYNKQTGRCNLYFTWSRFYNDPQPHDGTVGIGFTILALG